MTALAASGLSLNEPGCGCEGPEWRGTDDYVFSTSWGEPIHPDTVSSLMTTLINTHNDQQGEPLPHARLHDLRHVHATTARNPRRSFAPVAPSG